MTILVIDKEINIDSSRFRHAEEQATMVINFSHSSINSSKVHDFSKEYNDLREEIRIKYLKFVAELGEQRVGAKSLKEQFLLKKGCSLWWFSEIVHKDSFNDPFLDDLCKAIAIKRLAQKTGEQKIVAFTNSLLLAVLAGKADHGLWQFAYSRFRGRISFLWHFYRNKMKLLTSGLRDCNQKSDRVVLFLAYYPQNWTYDAAGNFSDRFFRGLPKRLNKYGYIINIFPGDTSGKKPLAEINNGYFVHNNIGWLEILCRFFNLINFLKYLWERKKIKKWLVFEDVDISPVFERYLIETVILNDFSYWVHMRSAEKIIRKVKPSQIVGVDEFGAYSRIVIVAAHKYGVIVTWLQHAVMAKWRLWLFNMPQEISDANGNINTDFIARMPVADRFFVWGRQALKMMSEFGYPPNRIIVTGNPRYDIYKDKLGKDKIGVGGLLVLTPSVDRDEIKHFICLAEDLRQAFPKREIVVKFHPRYKDVINATAFSRLQQLKLKRIEIKTDSIENYYHNSNIIISGVSTAGIEAAYFGAKVITMLSRYNDRFTPDWLEESAVAYSSDELLDKVRNIEYVKQLAWADYYESPGRAMDTVLKALNE